MISKDIPSSLSPEEIGVLSFHHLPGHDAEIGIFAGLFTLTEPMEAHRHDFWEIAFAVRGSGQHEDVQARLPLLSGDVWVIRPGQWHAYPLVKDSLSIFNLLLTDAFLKTHAAVLHTIHYLAPLQVQREECNPLPSLTLPARHLHLSPQRLEHMYSLLTTLANEVCSPYLAGHAGMCTGLILSILSLLDRYSLEDAHEGSEILTARDHPGVLEAVRFIDEEFAQPLMLEDIAQRSGYTPTYLTRKFRHALGMSPMDYLLFIRLQHACTFLKTTQQSVTSIAHAVGFSDSRYFATRFRSALGMTPTQFRDHAYEQNSKHLS